MKRSIKSRKAKSSTKTPETPSKAINGEDNQLIAQTRDQRIALGEAFGSKRSKAAIQSQLSSQVDAKALESMASQIYDNVKAATEGIPSQGRNFFS